MFSSRSEICEKVDYFIWKSNDTSHLGMTYTNRKNVFERFSSNLYLKGTWHKNEWLLLFQSYRKTFLQSVDQSLSNLSNVHFDLSFNLVRNFSGRCKKFQGRCKSGQVHNVVFEIAKKTMFNRHFLNPMYSISRIGIDMQKQVATFQWRSN
jgi:hypothetical protein